MGEKEKERGIRKSKRKKGLDGKSRERKENVQILLCYIFKANVLLFTRNFHFHQLPNKLPRDLIFSS